MVLPPVVHIVWSHPEIRTQTLKASLHDLKKDQALGPCIADAHAHLYPFYKTGIALSWAHQNLSNALDSIDFPDETAKALLVVDPVSGPFVPPPLRDAARFLGAFPWRATNHPDHLTVELRRETDGARLFLIQGYQVRAQDGLEVLALATDSRFEDGLPFQEALQSVLKSDAILVLPWGFGKWTWDRGKKVRSALPALRGSRSFVGDNSGRPRLSHKPPLIREAARTGVLTLPGSDPLPIPGEERKLGRYSFILESGFHPDAPGATLKASLEEMQEQPAILGERESLLEFLRIQFWRRMKTVIPPGARKPERGPGID
jgi:hypothetical protein